MYIKKPCIVRPKKGNFFFKNLGHGIDIMWLFWRKKLDYIVLYTFSDVGNFPCIKKETAQRKKTCHFLDRKIIS